MQHSAHNLPWGSNPLYAILHESIYCQGAASEWAAEAEFKSGQQDEFQKTASPLLFTGTYGPLTIIKGSTVLAGIQILLLVPIYEAVR